MLKDFMEYIDSGALDWALLPLAVTIIVWAVVSEVRRRREKRQQYWAIASWVHGEENVRKLRTLLFRDNITRLLICLAMILGVVLIASLWLHLRARGWSLIATGAAAYVAAAIAFIFFFFLLVGRGKSET